MHNRAERNACTRCNEIVESLLHLYRVYERVQFGCKIDIELEWVAITSSVRMKGLPF